MAEKPFVRVNRKKLHDLIEQMADVIEATSPEDVEQDLGLPPVFAGIVPKNDAERMWRQAGVAMLIGMAIYEDAEAFLTHRVYGGPDS